MATQDIAVTDSPTALDDVASFVVGSTYILSNASAAIILYRVQAMAPAADAPGHAIPPFRGLTFAYVAGPERTFVWTRDPPGNLVVTETA